MGCKRLDTDFCHVLEIIHSEKRHYAGKKCVNYYPFGLEHKGYNNVTSGNVNSVASKFKYNGIELEESLGLNLYEMELRLYDPAIARWNAIDPVTHYSYSTYSAFDNNPVFWADPSGADSEISEDGNVITFTGQDAQDFFKILQANSGSADENNHSSDWQNAFEQQGESLSNLQNNIASNDASGNNNCCNWQKSFDIMGDVIDATKDHISSKVSDLSNKSFLERYLFSLGIVSDSSSLLLSPDGSYSQTNGKTGNFYDRPYNRLSRNAKSHFNFNSGLRTAGRLFTGLTLGYSFTQSALGNESWSSFTYDVAMVGISFIPVVGIPLSLAGSIYKEEIMNSANYDHYSQPSIIRSHNSKYGGRY